MTHRHSKRRIGASFYIEPCIGRCGRFRIVRRHGYYLSTFIANLCQEVSIWRTSQRYVRTPRHDVTSIIPVTRFRSISLFTPNLRAGRWQIGIPVIEGQWCTTHQVKETSPCCIGQHGHRRNYRESCVAVRTVSFCCI